MPSDKAIKIQKFCDKHLSGMPVTIRREDNGAETLIGPAKTFVIFLTKDHGHNISLSLLGDVAQSAIIFHALANKFDLEMAEPLCEDATDGSIKFGEGAYAALMQHRAAEAARNLADAHRAIQAEKDQKFEVVDGTGEAVSAESKIIA